MADEIEAAYKAALNSVEAIGGVVAELVAAAKKEIQAEENMRLAETRANLLRDENARLRSDLRIMTGDRDAWKGIAKARQEELERGRH